jgi:hypothetical protein
VNPGDPEWGELVRMDGTGGMIRPATEAEWERTLERSRAWAGGEPGADVLGSFRIDDGDPVFVYGGPEYEPIPDGYWAEVAARPGRCPEGGFTVAFVRRYSPVTIEWRAYSADFQPSDLFNGAQGLMTPFDESQVNAIVLRAGHEVTMPWSLFLEDMITWGAVTMPKGELP